MVNISPRVSICTLGHQAIACGLQILERLNRILLAVLTVVRLILVKVGVKRRSERRDRHGIQTILAVIIDQLSIELAESRGRNSKLEEADVRTKVLEIVKEAKEMVSLTDADIICSGGRGLGGPEGFELIKAFADKVGGVVGSSRACVDNGWIDHAHQVGQTGTTVKPQIYFACGISGAIQHLAGMQNSDIIVAINKDPDAPIFEVADYGIVGDLYKVIPQIMEAWDK